MNKEMEWERTVSGLEKFRKISDKNIPVKKSLSLSPQTPYKHTKILLNILKKNFLNNAHSINEIYMTILW